MLLEDLQNGYLFLIDKPLDWTSFDVVNKIRWNIRKAHQIKKIKVGHAGTLDPKATGLLLICTGKFTKKINELQAQHKVYTGTVKLGATTPTYDTESKEDKTFSVSHLTNEKIIAATQQFIGNIEQHPPIHSAIKIDGKRMYDLARAGEEVVTKARNVTIYDFKITHIELPFVEFKVHCSKGTYIRSLAYDFGKALQTGAYLTALRRTHIGDYTVDDANNNPLSLDFFEKK